MEKPPFKPKDRVVKKGIIPGERKGTTGTVVKTYPDNLYCLVQWDDAMLTNAHSSNLELEAVVKWTEEMASLQKKKPEAKNLIGVKMTNDEIRKMIEDTPSFLNNAVVKFKDKNDFCQKSVYTNPTVGFCGAKLAKISGAYLGPIISGKRVVVFDRTCFDCGDTKSATKNLDQFGEGDAGIEIISYFEPKLPRSLTVPDNSKDEPVKESKKSDLKASLEILSKPVEHKPEDALKAAFELLENSGFVSNEFPSSDAIAEDPNCLVGRTVSWVGGGYGTGKCCDHSTNDDCESKTFMVRSASKPKKAVLSNRFELECVVCEAVFTVQALPNDIHPPVDSRDFPKVDQPEDGSLVNSPQGIVVGDKVRYKGMYRNVNRPAGTVKYIRRPGGKQATTLEVIFDDKFGSQTDSKCSPEHEWERVEVAPVKSIVVPVVVAHSFKVGERAFKKSDPEMTGEVIDVRMVGTSRLVTVKLDELNFMGQHSEYTSHEDTWGLLLTPKKEDPTYIRVGDYVKHKERNTFGTVEYIDYKDKSETYFKVKIDKNASTEFAPEVWTSFARDWNFVSRPKAETSSVEEQSKKMAEALKSTSTTKKLNVEVVSPAEVKFPVPKLKYKLSDIQKNPKLFLKDTKHIAIEESCKAAGCGCNTYSVTENYGIWYVLSCVSCGTILDKIPLWLDFDELLQRSHYLVRRKVEGKEVIGVQPYQGGNRIIKVNLEGGTELIIDHTKMVRIYDGHVQIV